MLLTDSVNRRWRCCSTMFKTHLQYVFTVCSFNDSSSSFPKISVHLIPASVPESMRSPVPVQRIPGYTTLPDNAEVSLNIHPFVGHGRTGRPVFCLTRRWQRCSLQTDRRTWRGGEGSAVKQSRVLVGSDRWCWSLTALCAFLVLFAVFCSELRWKAERR